MRFGALFLGLTVSLFAGSCGPEDKSGACTGEMSGAYFRLEVVNYLTDTSIDIRINGRFIATVGRGDPIPQTDQIEGELRRLGEFPVCDKMVIDARGNNSYSQRFCSKPRYLSPECSGPPNNDFCWESIAFLPSADCLAPGGQCVPPDVIATPQCPCPYEPPEDPAAAWEAC